MTPATLAKSGSEDGHQAAVFAWANMAERHGFDAANDELCYTKKGYAIDAYSHCEPVDALWLLHSTPNGGKREKATAARLRQTGVKAGYPDISLDVAQHGYHGLRIEMKKLGTGTLSPTQKEWLTRLNDKGYLAITCAGWNEAVNVLRNYLKKD